MGYKKCPRCNLNYIKDTEVLCKVCQEEVEKAIANSEEEEYEICPECGENIIKAGEEMCYHCMIERMKEEATMEDEESDLGSLLVDGEDEGLLGDDESENLDDFGEIELDEDLDYTDEE